MRTPTGGNRQRVVKSIKLLKRAAQALHDHNPEFAYELWNQALDLEAWIRKVIGAHDDRFAANPQWSSTRRTIAGKSVYKLGGGA